MSDSAAPALLESKAYLLFLAELDGHLTAARSVVSAGGEPSPEQWLDLERKFHTIRGSAGFMALSEIARHAAELEKICGDRSAEMLDPHLAPLEELARMLPRPCADG